MKYPWLGATIILFWLMAAFTIVVREDVRPDYLLGIALVASLILGIWGFRVPK